MDNRNNFCSERVAMQPPREVVGSPCLEAFHNCEDVALRGTVGNGHGGLGW